MKTQNIRWEVDKGRPSKGLTHHVIAKVSGFVKKANGIKIGMTSSPENRVGPYGDAYDEMVVFWKSSSLEDAKQFERILTGYYMKNDDRCENKKRGGGNPGRGEYYYVYVVLRYDEPYRGSRRLPWLSHMAKAVSSVWR